MTGGADLTILVPVWQRVHNLPRMLASATRTVPDAEVVFVTNADDVDAVAAVQELAIMTGDVLQLVVEWPGGSSGDYARKINAAYRATSRPLVFTGADDIEFTEGWDVAARALMTLVPWPDECLAKGNAVGVVGTVDACNERTMIGTLSTHSLVARWYADFGGCVDQEHCIYHEGYDHEYVDDELVGTAVSRGAYAHAFDSVVVHHHPLSGAAPMDATYARGRSRTRHSRRLFNQRRRLWGGHARRG